MIRAEYVLFPNKANNFCVKNYKKNKFQYHMLRGDTDQLIENTAIDLAVNSTIQVFC